MATKIWATLRADGFKSPLSIGKGVSVFNATGSDVDEKTVRAVTTLAGLDILTIADKEAGRVRGGEGEECQSTRE